NQYPSYDSLYKNAFIASRLRRYREAGFQTDVYCVRDDTFELSYREFDGTEVLTGPSDALSEIARAGSIDRVLIHFLSPSIWDALKDVDLPGGATVWIHGFEAQPWWRREVLYETPEARAEAETVSERKMQFWHEVISTAPESWHFVFVSDWLAQTFFEDTGISLPSTRYSIVHNIVDNDRFSYQEKE